MSRRLALHLYGIRLRADALEHFLRESRLDPSRRNLSAAAHHAAALRRRAQAAVDDLTTREA